MSKIFTAAALERHTLPELRSLFHEAQQDLAASREGSAERRTALANLETIGRAVAKRTAAGPSL